MPQLALKANEISNELVDILANKTELTEMQFYRYIKDIEKLHDNSSEDYLKALANAAYGRKDAAVAFFEESLKQNNSLIAQNYIVYLNDYGTYTEVYEAVERLVDRFYTPTMVDHAWETNLFTGHIDKAIFYVEKLINMVDEKEADMLKNLAANALKQSRLFKRTTGISDHEFQDIAKRVVDVMDNHKVSPIAISFYAVPEEKTSSYVMSVNTLNPDVLSDMNLDIAFSLAENDGLIGKPFSVWFEGSTEDAVRASL
ncbi:TPA: hypothetical protein MC588_004404 [Citrobacter amalonaticus]|uniref:hypothetical protein n=1 Tax=Citrobacter TaxID=544 RepID=UPI00190530F1|nr:hypothetical protein [Citrobacter amalonaticus]EKW5096038.1 hypothetical protein [Citrobacter amalonaticus]MBJ9318952.1 hypothetical protein [Citrobacter amalonaticus]HBU6574898.1 hypothetical protein [Citrobacter amalonaticus]